MSDENRDMNIEELESRISEIKSRISEFRAAAVERNLTEPEEGEWEELNAELDSCESNLEKRKTVLDRAEELAEKPENREEERSVVHTRKSGVPRGEEVFDLSTIRANLTDPTGTASEFKERARRAVDQVRTFPHEKAKTEPVQEHLERLIDSGNGADIARHIILTGGQSYARAWHKRMGQQPLSSEEQRSLNLTAGEGGYLLPYTLDPTIIPVTDGAINPIRSLASVVQTPTNVWKGVTSEGMTAAYREAEGEETTDDSPEFAQPEITCYAADAFAQWTYEFGQDFGSISPELARMVQRAKDILEATKLLKGEVGEKEPDGVLTGATEVEESATESVFAAEDVYTLQEALGDFYTSNATWLAHRGVYHEIQQFETEGGGPLWQTLNTLQAGAGTGQDGRVPRALLEYPAYRISTMESEAKHETIALLFGNFDYYKIADRVGMLAKPIDNIPGEEGKPTGQEGLYFFWRNGAKVMHKKAFRALEIQ